MQVQRFDRIATLARGAFAGAALAVLLAGVGATTHTAAAAGPCVESDGLDPDRDGLTCNEEAVYYGTDPLAYDTDGDGVGDGYEVANGTDPLRFDGSVPTPPPSRPDGDADGLSDADEWGFYGTNPYVSDTDGDGWDDGTEVFYGSNPLDHFCSPTGCG
jgi:hypothetical protein